MNETHVLADAGAWVFVHLGVVPYMVVVERKNVYNIF